MEKDLRQSDFAAKGGSFEPVSDDTVRLAFKIGPCEMDRPQKIGKVGEVPKVGLEACDQTTLCQYDALMKLRLI